MSDATLGQLLDEKAQRDAIHIAIAPVIAGEALIAGDHVGLNASGEADTESAHIGIVDPFLKKRVSKGDRFWLCLYQKTITGMRHHWEHPAFVESVAPAADAKAEAEMVIRKWIERYKGPRCNSFERLVADWIDGDVFIFEGYETPDELETDPIKTALAIYTGYESPDFYFSCTC